MKLQPVRFINQNRAFAQILWQKSLERRKFKVCSPLEPRSFMFAPQSLSPPGRACVPLRDTSACLFECHPGEGRRKGGRGNTGAGPGSAFAGGSGAGIAGLRRGEARGSRGCGAGRRGEARERGAAARGGAGLAYSPRGGAGSGDRARETGSSAALRAGSLREARRDRPAASLPALLSPSYKYRLGPLRRRLRRAPSAPTPAAHRRVRRLGLVPGSARATAPRSAPRSLQLCGGLRSWPHGLPSPPPPPQRQTPARRPWAQLCSLPSPARPGPAWPAASAEPRRQARTVWGPRGGGDSLGCQRLSLLPAGISSL
jgi:hypothetical protein